MRQSTFTQKRTLTPFFAIFLLVANHGDGRINVFDPTSGAHLGCLQDSAGNPIIIDGLRALQF